MYELVILGMLMKYNAHGFLLAKVINDIVGPVAKASNGRIYPLLNKLTEDGMVEIAAETVSEGGLPMRIYRITDRGRMRFHHLMLDTTSNPRDYWELFGLKVVYFPALVREERIYLLNHFISYCEAHIRHITAEMEDHRVRHGLAQLRTDYTIEAQEHNRRRWQMTLDWAIHLRSEELGQTDPAPAAIAPYATLAALTAAIQGSAHLSEAEKEEHLSTVAELQRQFAAVLQIVAPER